MKRVSLTYPVWLVLVGGCAVLTFHRINKHNFYHHYYRVIEEVQTRNSQEWIGTSVVHIFSESLLTEEADGQRSLWEHAGAKFFPSIEVASPLLKRVPSLGLLRTLWYLYAHPAQAP